MKRNKSAASEHGAGPERQRSEVVAIAIKNAFDTLGPDMKEMLLFHLANDQKYVIGQQDSLVALERALEKIFNAGVAKMLMDRVHIELEKVDTLSSEK